MSSGGADDGNSRAKRKEAVSATSAARTVVAIALKADSLGPPTAKSSNAAVQDWGTLTP